MGKCWLRDYSGATFLRYTFRKKQIESISDTSSAMKKHHHTLCTLPLSERSHATGMSTTSWRPRETIRE